MASMTGGSDVRVRVAEELTLEARVSGGRMGRAAPLAVEVAGGDGGEVVADGAPGSPASR
jgi:hypothetical protein